MKVLNFVLLIGITISLSANASVCSTQGKITSIIPSAGIAGFKLDVTITGCNCSYDLIWVDTNTDSGMAMYSAALAAKMSDKNVLATMEDEKGQGTAGNQSITYRYWPSCKLAALEVL